MQVVRKESGCEVGQYVSINYFTESDEVKGLIEKNIDGIKKSILLKEFTFTQNIQESNDIKVGEDILSVKIL